MNDSLSMLSLTEPEGLAVELLPGDVLLTHCAIFSFKVYLKTPYHRNNVNLITQSEAEADCEL